MRTWSLLTKNEAQKQLHVYNKRYEEYKKDGKTWKETLKITAAIRSKKKTLALLDEREQIVTALANKVEEFIGVKIFRKSSSNEPKCVLAKNLFYKKGLEIGLKGSDLAWYTGCEKSHPERQRRHFQRSFSHVKRNKDMWEEFKLWYKLENHDTKQIHLPDSELPKGSTGKQQKKNSILETGREDTKEV